MNDLSTFLQSLHSELAPVAHYTTMDELKKILSEEKSFLTKSLLILSDSAILYSQIVEPLHVRFGGKKSPLQSLLKSIKNLPQEDRKPAGALIHQVVAELEAELQSFLDKKQIAEEEFQLSQNHIDFTLPTTYLPIGSRHPVSVVLRDLLIPFQKMGFSVIDGPECDTDEYNFDLLNVLKNHPAREMQDTLFLSSEWVLRTHTSNVQSHAMKERGVPLKIVCPGCVYRNEMDMTHVPAFRQMECLVIDKGIHMGHLRHIIGELLNAAFGRPVNIRFRASYFPFTEPSAEVDVECQQCFGKGCRSCKHSGWSEIGGCGVVNKKVLRNASIDSSIYSGIAFGFGVDRIAKDRFGVDDLRSLFDGQVSFLQSFSLV